MESLRNNIRTRFWELFEELENYDPYVAVNIQYQRRIDWCITVKTSNGDWGTTPVIEDGTQSFVISKRQCQSLDKAMLSAYVDMARILPILQLRFMN